MKFQRQGPRSSDKFSTGKGVARWNETELKEQPWWAGSPVLLVRGLEVQRALWGQVCNDLSGPRTLVSTASMNCSVLLSGTVQVTSRPWGRLTGKTHFHPDFSLPFTLLLPSRPLLSAPVFVSTCECSGDSSGRGFQNKSAHHRDAHAS